MTSYPLSRLEHLRAAFFGFARCEICNSRSHSAPECGLLSHERYVGLFDGFLHADQELEAFYREKNLGLFTEPEAHKRWEHVAAWASQNVSSRSTSAAGKPPA